MDPKTEIQTDLAEVPTPEPTPLFDYRGNGKVARFPKEIRSRINQMLDDSLPYLQIIQNLGESAGPLTEKCVGSWKKGGHRDYLREQQLLEQFRVSQEFITDLVHPA